MEEFKGTLFYHRRHKMWKLTLEDLQSAVSRPCSSWDSSKVDDADVQPLHP
jgi:hypothetical protein